jgi:hypothetical protein
VPVKPVKFKPCTATATLVVITAKNVPVLALAVILATSAVPGAVAPVVAAVIATATPVFTYPG